ncbi:MAG TPA: hypothetical protein VFT47_07320 [Vicinamibacterales bacterium]|nr:hypothetical protein [Vicinamibacterales bacterium]
MTQNSHSPLITAAARVADEHLGHALAAIHDARTLGPGTLPDARQHIRKVRVLMRLIDPWLENGAGEETRRRLRTLNRRLAPLADGALALRTMAHLAARESGSAARPAIVAVRDGLLQQAALNSRAGGVEHLLRHSETAIAVERARIGAWRETERHRQPLTTELEHGMRRARRSIAAALDRAPSHDHTWRRAGTELWVCARLLDSRRGDLRALRSILEALDASLEESRTVRTLEAMLFIEPMASRTDTATVLRLLRRYQREVRARAVARGRAALATILGGTGRMRFVSSRGAARPRAGVCRGQRARPAVTESVVRSRRRVVAERRAERPAR